MGRETALKKAEAFVIGLVAAAFGARGVHAIVSGQSWLAPRMSPPSLVTGSAALFAGLGYLMIAAFLVAVLGHGWRGGRAPVVLAGLCLVAAAAFFGMSFLGPG